MQNRQTETIANAMLHQVSCLTGPPTKLSIDQDSALTSLVIKELLTSLECTMQIISPCQSRKTDSNNWQHDKQTLDAEGNIMAFICSS